MSRMADSSVFFAHNLVAFQLFHFAKLPNVDVFGNELIILRNVN